MIKRFSLISSIFFGLSFSVHAENWQKIISCENGNAYIDVNTDERQNLQLVIKSDNLLGRLYHEGFISLQYGQQEFLLRGYHAELQQISPTRTEPRSLGGVFYPHDFKKMEWSNWNGNAREVELRGNKLFFSKLSISAGQSCDYEFEGECQGGVYHKTYVFYGSYVFNDCHLLE